MFLKFTHNQPTNIILAEGVTYFTDVNKEAIKIERLGGRSY